MSPLSGCVNDSYNVKAVLDRNSDGSTNFDCKHLSATDINHRITNKEINELVSGLFERELDTALFYFAGHGHTDSDSGLIFGSDSRDSSDGVQLNTILNKATNATKIKNKIIILDSCFSGSMGESNPSSGLSNLCEGMTILTSSQKDQYSLELDGGGVFTTLLVDGLSGSAANITGDITPGSVYAHIDQSLGAWDQRPIFKTNVRQFVSLRQMPPKIQLDDLRKITEYFPTPASDFPLDPSYEPQDEGRTPDMPRSSPEKTSIFKILQSYNRHGLLVPVGCEHMWHAAMESRSCKLTALGSHYRNLVLAGRI